MERQTGRKAWQKPELTVLVRSKPEEAVLLGCKLNNKDVGASSANEACQKASDCDHCELYSPS